MPPLTTFLEISHLNDKIGEYKMIAYLLALSCNDTSPLAPLSKAYLPQYRYQAHISQGNSVPRPCKRHRQ